MRKDPLNGKRSDCPVNYAVETLGDKWSLVILRDIIFWGKHTFGEFLRSEEQIATNILSDRLDYLVREGLIAKSSHPTDRRKEYYSVTEKAVDLVPLFLEMIAWSANQNEWLSMDHSGATPEQAAFVQKTLRARNRTKLIEKVKQIVREGRCVFEGVQRNERQRKVRSTGGEELREIEEMPT